MIFFFPFLLVTRLTCLEEVSLGEARRILAFLWCEEETNSTNLEHKNTHACSNTGSSTNIRLVCSAYKVFFEQSQAHAVREHALPAAEPLRSVIVDKTSVLQKTRTEPGQHADAGLVNLGYLSLPPRSQPLP